MILFFYFLFTVLFLFIASDIYKKFKLRGLFISTIFVFTGIHFILLIFFPIYFTPDVIFVTALLILSCLCITILGVNDNTFWIFILILLVLFTTPVIYLETDYAVALHRYRNSDINQDINTKQEINNIPITEILKYKDNFSCNKGSLDMIGGMCSSYSNFNKNLESGKVNLRYRINNKSEHLIFISYSEKDRVLFNLDLLLPINDEVKISKENINGVIFQDVIDTLKNRYK